MCDVFLPSLEDVAALVGLHEPDAVIDWAHALGASSVVLKLGSDGALISQRVGDEYRRERIPGHAVELVDATGAGDCFCGNLLARLARGQPLAMPHVTRMRRPLCRCRVSAQWHLCRVQMP